MATISGSVKGMIIFVSHSGSVRMLSESRNTTYSPAAFLSPSRFPASPVFRGFGTMSALYFLAISMVWSVDPPSAMIIS